MVIIIAVGRSKSNNIGNKCRRLLTPSLLLYHRLWLHNTCAQTAPASTLHSQQLQTQLLVLAKLVSHKQIGVPIALPPPPSPPSSPPRPPFLLEANTWIRSSKTTTPLTVIRSYYHQVIIEAKLNHIAVDDIKATYLNESPIDQQQREFVHSNQQQIHNSSAHQQCLIVPSPSSQSSSKKIYTFTLFYRKFCSESKSDSNHNNKNQTMSALSRIRQNYHEESEAGVNKQINLELYASYVYQQLVSGFCLFANSCCWFLFTLKTYIFFSFLSSIGLSFQPG